MTNKATFTKKICKSGRGFLLWIPKNVIDVLRANERTTIEAKVRVLRRTT